MPLEINNQDLDIPDLPGISLVAYYRDKPDKLSLLIRDVQQQLDNIYGNNFIPYDLDQVHGTVIGCEGLKIAKGIVNKWFYKHRNELKYSDFSGLLSYFSNTKILPLKIRFGGYQQDVDYQFLSRRKHPTNRSFQLQNSDNNQLIPIIIGWSSIEQEITTDFNQLRYDCQQYNFLHKYHQQEHDIDNDFYLRLGTITNNSNNNHKIEAEKIIIDYLQKRSPTIIELSNKNLALVKYQNLLLPLNNTEYYPLEKLNIDDDFINYLY